MMALGRNHLLRVAVPELTLHSLSDGIALVDTPALAEGGCDVLKPGECSRTTFIVCFPEGPWGPAYCTENEVVIVGVPVEL